MIKILFVCLGNICRSPTADGLMRQLVTEAGLADKIQIDSAGTSGMHTGKGPDARTQAIAKEKGCDLSQLQARQFVAEDFNKFDYILAMDNSNLDNILNLASSAEDKAKAQLFLNFSDSNLTQVPDPYYGGEEDFYQVFDLIHTTCKQLLSHLRNEHAL